MKNRSLVILFVAALLLVTATAVSARTELAEFTVQNRSDFTVYIALTEAFELRHNAQSVEYPPVENAEFYYLPVGPDSTVTFTVKRALYAYTMVTCGGKYVSGAIDLNNGGTMRIPSLCVFYEDDYEERGTVDGILEQSDLVAFSIINTTDTTLYYTMTGPQTVSFWLEPNQSRSFTVAEGEYSYSYSQCADGVVRSGTLTPHYHQMYKLTCP